MFTVRHILYKYRHSILQCPYKFRRISRTYYNNIIMHSRHKYKLLFVSHKKQCLFTIFQPEPAFAVTRKGYAVCSPFHFKPSVLFQVNRFNPLSAYLGQGNFSAVERSPYLKLVIVYRKNCPF